MAKILVIDDNPSIVKLLARSLTLEGYDVVSANDGEDALNKFAKEKPDLVLLDLMLPGLNGFQICRIIREKYICNHVPILFLSARYSTEDKVKGLEVGADDYVTKPFDNAELMARVRSLIQRKWAYLEHVSNYLYAETAFEF